MNEKSKIRFLKIEHPNLCILIFLLNGNIPCFEVLEFSNNIQDVEVYNKIHKYVVTERHFLDKDITVNTIVRQCDVKKKLLNKILRLKENLAFHGYINKQRVIYATNLLLDPSNKLIEVVAEEASFNNSRTFVRNFKAVYNMTPSEYRNRYGLKKC
ncbi:helix-turn-helix domain-containing protein [uncultured Parabacteroides sp.]|jgi:AraC-like DNA-binding protein|uniref:helix-turn-helix domain-containing protein n=1 Tax=uncultured Parabacteroides sp. TaxID=512312 RepID=UPI0025F6E48C|nr:helix-turn-helix domain-containing protein [uncultured Parabacteroides sp.]